jgi:hypothetical protein
LRDPTGWIKKVQKSPEEVEGSMWEFPMKVGKGIGLKLSRESGISESRTVLREESPSSDSRNLGN